ncbi:MAG: hypothetical protein IKR68_04440 [Lachnospiraceae bacterium]|nr:hypothetical protein [Lachnospiraceae bacterium]
MKGYLRRALALLLCAVMMTTGSLTALGAELYTTKADGAVIGESDAEPIEEAASEEVLETEAVSAEESPDEENPGEAIAMEEALSEEPSEAVGEDISSTSSGEALDSDAETAPAFSIDIVSNGVDKVKVEDRTGQASSSETVGGLSMSCSYKTLNRDYAQKIPVTIYNSSRNPVQFYLECENDNEDLYMNFVESGTKEAPLTVQAGSNQQVDLSVFAQNAKKTSYSVGITAHIVNSDDLHMDCSFGVKAATGRVSFTAGNIAEGSLAQTFTVKNTGGAITDLNISLTGDAAGYARLDPMIENYNLASGGVVEFKLVPDLAKIHEENLSTINGALTAEGGATGSLDVSIDVSGKQIHETTLGYIAMLQDGNPFADMTHDESVFSFTAGEDNDLAALAATYYDPSDPEKDGVNTAEEFTEVVNSLFDENGMMDYTINDKVRWVENGVTKTAPIKTTVKAVYVPAGNDTAGEEDATGTVSFSNGNVVTTSTYSIPAKDYKERLAGVTGAAQELGITGVDGNALNLGQALEDAGEVVVSVRTEVGNAIMDLADSIKENPELYPDESIKRFGQLADSSLYQYAKTAGDVLNYFDTAKDIYDTANVISDPNISNTDKVLYTGLQVARNANRYWGAQLFGEAGAAIGGTLFDGPGAVVGYITGHVVSWALDRVLEKALNNLEAYFSKNGGYGFYYDIYGHQCTNAGKVRSEFTLPSYTAGVTPRIHETGRMYDKSEKNYFVDKSRVGYVYLINGKKVEGAESENDGLTQITYVDLSKGAQYLKPGKNEIIRDYDTNPGHYFIEADTEITLVWPSDMPVAYEGDSGKELAEVRLLPDFTVYRENITTAETPIAGEANEMQVNVFNRGSRGGWVDVTVNEGSKQIHKEEKLYVEAFSGKTLKFSWTPATTGDHAISVVLENAAPLMPERKTDNNSANRTIPVRSRQVPEISEISPAEVFLDKEDDVYITAQIEDAQDLTGVVFTVGDTQYDKVDITKLNETVVQASTPVKLSEGSHQIKVTAQYRSGKETTDSVTQTAQLIVKKPPVITFSTDETITDPEFFIVRNSTYQSPFKADVTSVDGKWTLKAEKEVDDNKANYVLFMRCKEGILVEPLDTLSDKTLTLTGAGQITLDESEDVKNVSVYRMNYVYYGSGKSINNLENVMKWDDYYGKTFLVGSNITNVQIAVKYSLGNSTSRFTAYSVKASPGAVTNWYRLFKIGLADETFASPFVMAYYHKTEGNATGTFSLNNRMYEPASHTEYLLCTESNIINNYIDKADKLMAILYSGSECYTVDLKGEALTADPNNNGSLKFVYKGEGDCKVTGVNACVYPFEGVDYKTVVSLAADDKSCVSLPKGSYDITVSYTVGGNRYFHSTTATVGDTETTVELPDVMAESAKLTFNWPEGFGSTMTVSFTVDNRSYSLTDLPNGASAKFPVGTYDITMGFLVKRTVGNSTSNAREITLKRNLTLSDGDEKTITVGSEFTGTAAFWSNSSFSPTYSGSKYNPGAMCNFRQDVADADGNKLERLYIYDGNQLNGEFTLIGEDEERYEGPFTVSNAMDFYANVPEETKAGTYSYTLHMTDKQLFCYITTTVQGDGVITPNTESVAVKKGGNKTFTFKANKGSYIKNVIVDGSSVGAVSEYTFENVESNHTLKVVFAKENETPGPDPIEPGPNPEDDEDDDPQNPSGSTKASGMDGMIKIVSGNLIYMVKGQKSELGKGSWTSDKKDVVSVAKKSGKVTAKKEGTATIANGDTKYTVRVIEPVLSDKKVNLVTGTKQTVTLSGIPAELSSEYPVSWVSSNVKVATVKKGKITAMGTGSTAVKAYVKGKAYSCKVKVTDNYANAKIQSDKADINLKPFQTLKLKYDKSVFTPKNAIWEAVSGNEISSWKEIKKKDKAAGYENDVLGITSAGAVTAKKEGKLVLKGKDANNRKVSLTIRVSTDSQKKLLYLNKGKSAKLSYYKVKAKDATWKVSDNSIAEVDAKGKVSTKNVGKTGLTCVYKGVTYHADIVVEEPELKTDDKLKAAAKPGQYTLELSLPENSNGSEKYYHVKSDKISQTLSWKSSKTAGLFVDENGRIYPRKPGKYTVSTKVNGKAVKINVSVK